MHRPVSALVALALLLAACSGSDRPTLERVTGTIGPAAQGEVDAGSDEVPPGATDGSPADADGAAPLGGTAGTPTPDGANGTAAADAALAAYFDALQAQDFAQAQRVSTGGAAFLVRVREAVSRYNTERGGTARLHYPERSFSVGSSDGQRVAYVGAARLESTVSGPAGDPYTESARFENPVVSRVGTTWRVDAFTYDGQPIEHFPATATAKVGAVELRLQGALKLGSFTGLLIDLVTDANHSIKVDDARLTFADGTSATPKLAALIAHQPAALYYLFERRSSKPVSWSATVVIDEGTGSQVTGDVVLRF